MKNDQDLNKLLTAAQALLNDIEAMRADFDKTPEGGLEIDEGTSWYGPFSDNFTDCSYGDVTISWPNLEISATHVRDAMNELKKEGAV